MTKTNFNGTTIKRQSCYSKFTSGYISKGQNQDDKGKQQFKDNQHSQTEHQPNTQNQNNDQDSSDKSNTHLIKLKTHLQKEHNLNNHSL